MLFCVFQNCCGIFSCLIFISGTPKEKRVCWMILSDSNLVYRSGFFWEPKICRFSCEFDLKFTPISGFNIFVPYNFKNIDCVFIYLFIFFIYLFTYLFIYSYINVFNLWFPDAHPNCHPGCAFPSKWNAKFVLQVKHLPTSKLRRKATMCRSSANQQWLL